MKRSLKGGEGRVVWKVPQIAQTHRAQGRLALATRLALTALLMAFALTLATPTPALAEATTIANLMRAGQYLDGREVIIRGEVVGDILSAGREHKWLLLQDDGVTISVLIANDEASKITHLGRYGQIGTQIEVTGIFHTDCGEHDGLTDLHASRVIVLEEGSEFESPFSMQKLQAGAVLIFVGLVLFILHWRLKERTR